MHILYIYFLKILIKVDKKNIFQWKEMFTVNYVYDSEFYKY